MQITLDLLPVEKRGKLPENQDKLAFGQLRTDHMFLMDYYDNAWRNPRIVPYGPLSLMPGAMCLHYGQTLFEGCKAFMHDDGELYLFRFDKNAERLNHSAEVLCMPTIPVADQMQAALALLDVERHWCPTKPESSLYIRPVMFATQDCLGIRASSSYTYCIMLSPSGPYYADGFSKAIKLLVTEKYHRAAPGGTGSAKAGGNYGASLKPCQYAYAHGASQVLYLDASNEYIEEAGAMNHYHVLSDGTFVIPTFVESILQSVTSLSVLELGALGRIKARQDRVPIKSFLEDIKSGRIVEAGGFGTAAVVSPVGTYLMEDGTEYVVGDGGIGKYSRGLYELYSSIQTGRAEAPKGWLAKVERRA